MDVWGVAIKKEQMGKKLLHQMAKGNEILAQRKGMKYAFSYDCNMKTGVALIKLSYEKISQLDAREYEFNNNKPFALVDDANRYPCLWWKKLIL